MSSSQTMSASFLEAATSLELSALQQNLAPTRSQSRPLSLVSPANTNNTPFVKNVRFRAQQMSECVLIMTLVQTAQSTADSTNDKLSLSLSLPLLDGGMRHAVRWYFYFSSCLPLHPLHTCRYSLQLLLCLTWVAKFFSNPFILDSCILYIRRRHANPIRVVVTPFALLPVTTILLPGDPPEEIVENNVHVFWHPRERAREFLCSSEPLEY